MWTRIASSELLWLIAAISGETSQGQADRLCIEDDQIVQEDENGGVLIFLLFLLHYYQPRAWKTTARIGIDRSLGAEPCLCKDILV